MFVPLVRMRGISKSYPGVIALRDVDFSLDHGEVRALLGKNGAGKSTLIKILSGVETADRGEIALDGAPLSLGSPIEATRAGIATVYQELSLVPELSIGENIFLGHWPRVRGRIDWKAINERASAAMALVGLSLDPRRPVGDLSVAQGGGR